MSELRKPIVWPVVDCSGEPSVKGWPNLYLDLQDMRREHWTKKAEAYEANPENFYAAWHWLNNHPIFWYFGPRRRHESTLCSERGVYEGLEFCPVLVHPETLSINEDSALNTRVSIWVEVFPSSMKDDGRDGRLHDYVCDTGGDTYEKAVLEVAREIYERHGNDREVLTKEWTGA